MTDAEEIDGGDEPCPTCFGRGRVVSFTLPLVATAIGFGMAWFSWPRLSSIPTLTRAYTIESIILFAIAGPLIAIGSWWKLFWNDCADCGGTGGFSDGVLYQQPVTTADAAHRAVQCDQACHKCDYNVRGLLVGNRCPECGALIVSASQAQHIRDSRIELRAGLGAAVVFPIGLVVSIFLWGDIGPGYFVAGWIATYLLLRVILLGGRVASWKRSTKAG